MTPTVLAVSELEPVGGKAKADEVDLGVGGTRLIPGVLAGSAVVLGGACAIEFFVSLCGPRGVAVCG